MTIWRLLGIVIGAIGCITAPVLGQPVPSTPSPRINASDPAPTEPTAVHLPLSSHLPANLSVTDALAMQSAQRIKPRSAPSLIVVMADEADSGGLFENEIVTLTAAARQALDRVLAPYRGKSGLRLAIIGHADSRALKPELQRDFDDNMVLSLVRAREVAAYAKQKLQLPALRIATSARSDTEPMGDNRTVQGRARNRRIELQIWDPADAPSSPDKNGIARPHPAAAEDDDWQAQGYRPPTIWIDLPGKRVDNARVEVMDVPPPTEREPEVDYPLPSGVSSQARDRMRASYAQLPQTPAQQHLVMSDANLGGALFESGKSHLTPHAQAALEAFAQPLMGKNNLLIGVAGHADTQRHAPITKKIYRDNQGLSEARALTVATYLMQRLNVPLERVAIVGYGDTRPVADNGTLAGMALNRRVEIHAWFDTQPAASTAAESAARATQSAGCGAVGPKVTQPFRVTIDGEPMDVGSPNEADRQRCTDVALEQADIQVRYDALATAPAMNVWATPNAAARGEHIEFRAWSNFVPWVRRAEVRLFRPGQRTMEAPLAVLPITWHEPLRWQMPAAAPHDPQDRVFYLLRVYDEAGRFNETSLRPIDVLARAPNLSHEDRDRLEREKQAGYGENNLDLANIPVSGGTVTVNGRNLQPGQGVTALGLAVPVDPQGRFAIRQILPPGPHAVEILLRQPDGSQTFIRRNVTIPANDWFYVALGDLTIGRNKVTGPAGLVTGDTQHYEDKVYLDGRGAFYLKGKVKGEWLLTAAADTTEQPLRDLFSNFSSKDPRYLLRRIDPNLYYPVYGDDSTVVDDAPTQGKFYVRLERDDSQVLWGNFQTSWSGSELIQYSRGLYGAKGRYRSSETTRYGEKKTQVDAFAAEPGTLGGRDEFRGSGGSLYYLRHQNIMMGSERVWIETRDPDSELVIDRRPLSPAQDYEVNYLQGRILLRTPLASTGAASGLVMAASINGAPLYLIVTYEYVPGLDAIVNLSAGVQASQWVNDHLQVGVTGYRQGEQGSEQTLKGVQATLRHSPGTYVKVETAQSKGPGSDTQTSINGGFGFNTQSGLATTAGARRIEGAANLENLSDSLKGRISAYAQERDHGFSAPGQLTLNNERMSQQGAQATVALGPGTQLTLKADNRVAETQSSRNAEIGLRQNLSTTWALGLGLKQTDRQSTVGNLSPLLSQNGQRTDAIVRLDYQPERDEQAAEQPTEKPAEKADWSLYAFVQDTLDRTGNRAENDRVGLGGAWRVSERVKLLAEASQGGLGSGGRLGADYRISERSNAYLNYVIESENPDLYRVGRQGTWVSGVSSQVSDQVRVFGETRALSGAGPQSLSQAYGLDWRINERWSWGLKGEVGQISDPLSGDLRRNAMGVSAAYREGNTKYAGSVELRDENGTSTTGTSNISNHRTTWLVRNSLGLQLDRERRLLGKFNFSRSNNSQGAYYDGSFHEIVVGMAWRPVLNDRWNSLFKYTNFYNLPATGSMTTGLPNGQLTSNGLAADYAQRTQVFAVDTIYDLKPWLSVGGKYAARYGELQPVRNASRWMSSRADLWILRADWHWVREWDVVMEWRRLKVRQALDDRSGFLLAIYRHVQPGVKVGIGYNFTHYSDDLTDQSYRSEGWFINIIGAF